MIVVNDNYLRVPNADVLFAADKPWWKLHSQRISKTCPKIERWSCEGMTREFGTNVWPAEPGMGISDDKEYRYRRGSSSGFMATGLAIKWGARHIVLVGMDCKVSKDGKAHWFGDHPRPILPSPQPMQTWAREWDSLAAPAKERGIDVVNCTIDTAIKMLRRSTLEVELWPRNEQQVVRPNAAVEKAEQPHDSAA